MKSTDLSRAPGRPKTIDGAGKRVSSWLPVTLQQRIAEYAGTQSQSAAIRQALEIAFPPKK